MSWKSININGLSFSWLMVDLPGTCLVESSSWNKETYFCHSVDPMWTCSWSEGYRTGWARWPSWYCWDCSLRRSHPPRHRKSGDIQSTWHWSHGRWFAPRHGFLLGWYTFVLYHSHHRACRDLAWNASPGIQKGKWKHAICPNAISTLSRNCTLFFKVCNIDL